MSVQELFFRTAHGGLSICLILYVSKIVFRIVYGRLPMRHLLRVVGFLSLAVRHMFISLNISDVSQISLYDPGSLLNTSAAIATIFLGAWLVTDWIETVWRSRSNFSVFHFWDTKLLSQISQRTEREK